VASSLKQTLYSMRSPSNLVLVVLVEICLSPPKTVRIEGFRTFGYHIEGCMQCNPLKPRRASEN
jgi:hypothetical protein